jgi:hypothetical protein
MMMTERTYGTTEAGTPITEAMIASLSDEAEAGYALEQVRPRRGRPRLNAGAGTGEAETVGPVRLEDPLRAALAARMAADHTSASEVVRRALRKYLAAELRDAS